MNRSRAGRSRIWKVEDRAKRIEEVRIMRPGEEDKIVKPGITNHMISPTVKYKKEKDKKWVRHEGKWVKC